MAGRIFHRDSSDVVGGETGNRMPGRICAAGDPFVHLVAAPVAADHHKSHGSALRKAGNPRLDLTAGPARDDSDG